MGYTHYWYLNTKSSVDNYKKALKDIRKVIKDKQKILANGHGDKGTKPVTRGGIRFNGINHSEDNDKSYETFFLPKEPKDLSKNNFMQRDKKGYAFNFCKTGRQPYDVVVVACLCILKWHLRIDINIRSDGNTEDLREGLELAKRVTGLPLMEPRKEITNSIHFIKGE